MTVAMREGDWFAVPLEGSGYALGLVARLSRRGQPFGYFFPPRRAELPSLLDCQGLHADDAVFRCLFGIVGLRNGTWPTLGKTAEWDRSAWPLSELYRNEPLIDRWLLITYSDDQELAPVRKREVSREEAMKHPSEDLPGYLALAKILSRMLP